jgi:site-specific recombinase XerD
MKKKVRGVYEKIPGSGVWWIRYADSKGNMHREKVGRHGDAVTLYTKRRTEAFQRAKLPEKFRAKGITFSALCDDALEHAKAENTPDSAYELSLKIAAFLPAFGDRPAEEITKQDIVRWLTDEAGKRKWKPASRNRYQAAFSLVFRVGIDNEKITNNPAARIRRKTENNEKVRYLSADEEVRLKQAITNPVHLDSLLISIHTGMRQSEQYSLHWRQVDLERKLVHLPKTKNGEPRHIPLNAVAVAAFERLSASGHAKTSPVFPNASGDAIQGTRWWFKDAVERAGITGYTWHCNRHTFASRLVMAGVALHTVGKLFGHKTAQMTQRYTHLAPEYLSTAVDRLVPTELAPVLAPAVPEVLHKDVSN